jgi:hypothetical protein
MLAPVCNVPSDRTRGRIRRVRARLHRALFRRRLTATERFAPHDAVKDRAFTCLAGAS